MRIAFLGGGNMALALIGGIVRAGIPGEMIVVSDPHEEKRMRLTQEFGVHAFDGAGEWLSRADVIVLAVKPQKLEDCCRNAASFIRDDALVLSIAAGVSIAAIASWLGHEKIVRAMPNTPARVSSGVTGVFAPAAVDETGKKVVQTILASVGDVLWVAREEDLHVVTGGSGSGPAYVFLFMEALAQALQDEGMDEATARRMALGTVEGAARLARESGEPFAALRESVTSRGGTTARALEVFEAEDLRGTMARAVKACIARSKEMSAQFA